MCQKSARKAQASLQTKQEPGVPPGNVSNILQPVRSDSNVVLVAPDQRRKGKSMSRRSGQKGQVVRKGDMWHIRFYVDVPGQDKRQRKSLPIGPAVGKEKLTKPEAARKGLEIIEREGVNTSAHLERSRMRAVCFGDAARSWRDGHLNMKKKRASQKSMGCELRKHVLPLLDEMPIEDVNSYAAMRDLIQTWQSRDLSTKSIKNLFIIVRAVYNFRLDEMAEHGTTALAPWIVKWKRVRPVADIEEEQPCFEEEQMFAIVNGAKGRYRPLYALFAGSGMRFGEVSALLAENVRFVNDGTGVVTVRRSLSDDEISTTKANRVRHVPIDASVVQELKKYLGARRSGLLFSSRNGTPLRENNLLRDNLHPLLDKLKIPRAGFHAFRHGRCSFLVRSDVPRSVIREWIGHASDEMIDRYSHRWGKHGKQEMSRLIPVLDPIWTQDKKSNAA